MLTGKGVQGEATETSGEVLDCGAASWDPVSHMALSVQMGRPGWAGKPCSACILRSHVPERPDSKAIPVWLLLWPLVEEQGLLAAGGGWDQW